MASKEETETVITWTSADEQAVVHTMHQKIKRACEKAGAIEICKDEGIRDGKKEAWTFLINPACVKIRAPRVLTDTQRAALSLRGKQLAGNLSKERAF